jgi:hypothetical protein
MSIGALTKEVEYILQPESEDACKELHQRVKGGIEHWYTMVAVQEAMDMLKNRDTQSVLRRQKVVEGISLSNKTDEEILTFLKHRDLEIRSKVC